MSLFIGNVSRNISAKNLEEEFGKYGTCHVNLKGSYGFVEFNEERDAEDAMSGLQGKNLGGLEISIEWSKKSGKFDPSKSHRPHREKGELKCFECGRRGHISRDCTEKRGSRRSRSRSHDRGDRRRRRSHSRSKSRSHSRSHERSRSPPRAPPKRREDRSESKERRKRSPSSDRERSVFFLYKYSDINYKIAKARTFFREKRTFKIEGRKKI